jgi:multiple sugar transport system substrate-binding protein
MRRSTRTWRGLFSAPHSKADQFSKWLETAQGYLTHCLNTYDNIPVWTADPTRTIFRDAARRSLPVSGLGSVGEKAASAIADFVLLDMFASYCTGREDAKGTTKIARRQSQRIYADYRPWFWSILWERRKSCCPVVAR